MPSAVRPPPSRSLLLLHGSGGNAKEFTRRLGNHLSPWTLEAIDAPAGNGKWWTYPAGQRSFTASSYSGAEESIAVVEAALQAGNHAGVLGFSQGAMLAAIVAARSALGENNVPLKFAVLSASAMPKPYEALLHRLRDSPSPPMLMPTLHTLCKADDMNPAELGEEIAGCFGPRAEVLWHAAGHAVPPPGPEGLDSVAAFLERAMNDDA